MGEDRPDGVAVPIVWIGPEDVPILFTNAFVSQFDEQGGFILTFGQMTPPAVFGTPDQIAEQVEQIEFVRVKPVARFGLTQSRLQELILLLQENLDQFET